MTKTETMPRLRQYLRERGFRMNHPIAGAWGIAGLVIVSITKRAALATPMRGLYAWGGSKRFTDEQAAIDWLEANYPK